VNSVAQQITDNKFRIEYVIVDDKSPDNSRALVENYIDEVRKKFPDVTFKLVTPKENLGCGGARKFGIENATGQYFMFLDADDYYIHKNFILRAFNEITSKDDPDIVEYGIIFNTSDGRQQVSQAPQRMVVTNVETAELLLFKDNLIKFNVWSKIYKRHIVESYPYSTVRTFEDVRTIPVWVSNARKIVIMPSAEINYRAASNSIIRDDVIKTRLGTISGMVELLPFFKDNYNIVKAMYGRAMVDLTAMLHNHSSENEGFNEMSRLNDEFLKILYPDDWQKKVFHIEDEQADKKP
jgi:glycosyltransferase involved in cell wall biosynthesis